MPADGRSGGFQFPEKTPSLSPPPAIRAIISRVNAITMSSKELIHSVNNQLALVMAHADMLAREVRSEQDLERCREIKLAASKINRLLKALLD